MDEKREVANHFRWRLTTLAGKASSHSNSTSFPCHMQRCLINNYSTALQLTRNGWEICCIGNRAAAR